MTAKRICHSGSMIILGILVSIASYVCIDHVKSRSLLYETSTSIVLMIDK